MSFSLTPRSGHAPRTVALFLQWSRWENFVSSVCSPQERMAHRFSETLGLGWRGSVNHPGARTANQPIRSPGPSAGAAVTVAPAENETALRPKKTILCVDDNEQALSVRTFLLETRGYRVIPALSPQHALEVVEQSMPGSLDLLLSDLNMPQMDGNELVRRAKQLQPALPAMIVSGTSGSGDRACCADVYLPKGANSPAEMIERIRVLVARKRGPKKSFAPSRVEFDPAIAS